MRGVDERLATNIRAHVSLASRACTTPGAYLAALAARAEEESQDALRAYGYYHAIIHTRVQRGSRLPAGGDRGKPAGRASKSTAIALTVTGAARADSELYGAAGDAAAAVSVQGLNHDKYTATKRLLEGVALERGYLAGHFVEQRLEVDTAQ